MSVFTWRAVGNLLVRRENTAEIRTASKALEGLGKGARGETCHHCQKQCKHVEDLPLVWIKVMSLMKRDGSGRRRSDGVGRKEKKGGMKRGER